MIDHGRLIALGSHEQVLATCPVYERLFHARARRAAEAAPDDSATGDSPSAVRIDANGPSSPPQILPLPLARGIRLAAQAPEKRRDAS